MENVKTEMDGKVLVIRIDTSKEIGVSKSGKNTLVAKTGGNVLIPEANLTLGLNAYR